MFRIRSAALLPLIAMAGVQIAAAQTSSGHAMHSSSHPQTGGRPDPADPNAVVPTIAHRSALTDYRRLGEDTVGSWRDANSNVERIGGWRAYAREGQATPESARGGAPAAPGSPSAATPAPAHKH